MADKVIGVKECNNSLKTMRTLLRKKIFIIFFFFNDTATTEIYTLSLHDALPISRPRPGGVHRVDGHRLRRTGLGPMPDRKSTRLNSSHSQISYAVFCLKKKNKRSSN